MKRSTARWTTCLAAAALLGLPASGLAQTSASQPPTSSAQQPTTTPTDITQNQAAQDHLRQAKDALDAIAPSTLTGAASSQIITLKQHFATLDRLAGPTAGTDRTPATGAANESWSTEVATIDRIISDLIGPDTTAPSPTATTGTSGTTTATAKPPAAGALSDATRAHLAAVRSHVDAFAAAMKGGSTPEPSAAAAGAQAAGSTMAAQDNGAESSQPQVDADAAHQHLTEARNTLSELTQLPAAAELSGEARTQVSQLISNFNELITSQSHWRASYDKVDANLTALLGPDNTDAERTGGVSTGTTGTTGTTGAVGTAGEATPTVKLDPAIRAKLVDLRQKLKAFEAAAGGPTAGNGAPEAAAPAASMGREEAMQHIAAIEAILNANTPTTAASTTGSTTTPATGLTLTTAQLEQLRTHLAELERIVNGG